MTSTAAARTPAPTRPGPSGAASRWWLLDLALLVGVTALAAWLRADPLGPSSLWLDDAWVALVSRTEGLTELRYVGFSAPGFVLLLRGWFEVVGFSETAAQALPFAAGILAPGAAYLVARRFGWHRAAGLLAAAVLVFSPIAMVYATRVKSYTTEALLALVLLALAWWVLQDLRSVRRWAVLVGVSALATTISAFLAPYAGAAVLAGFVRALRDGDRTAALRAVAAGATFGLFAGVWYLAVLAPAVTSSITGFWSGHFLVLTEGFGPAIASLRSAASGVATGLSSLPAIVTVLVLVAATVAVAVRRIEVAVLLVTPLCIAVVLAALQLAPLGGGRTDLYLYSSLSLLVAGGVDALLRLLPRGSGGVLSVAAIVALAAVAAPVTPYPRYDVRPLVEQLEARREPDEALLVYPATMWAYALYTDDEVDLVADEVSAWGFAPRFGDEATYVLPRGRDDPAAYAPTVAEVAAAEDRVWLLASHWREDYDDLQEQLRTAGFERIEIDRGTNAQLSRWERR